MAKLKGHRNYEWRDGGSGRSTQDLQLVLGITLVGAPGGIRHGWLDKFVDHQLG